MEERRRRTAAFVELMLTADQQTAADLVHSAVVTHRTLRPRHLVLAIDRARTLRRDAWVRAVVVVHAAVEASSAAPEAERCDDEAVWNALLELVVLYRGDAATLDAAARLELRSIVGGTADSDAAVWWICRELQRRGHRVTSLPALRRIETALPSGRGATETQRTRFVGEQLALGGWEPASATQHLASHREPDPRRA
jgi:hypothetical protein